MIAENKTKFFENVAIVISTLLLLAAIGIVLFQGPNQLRSIFLVLMGLLLSLVLITRYGLTHFLTGGAILSFIFGWRGLEIVPKLRIWPAEVFIWAGFLFVLFDKEKRINIKRVDGDPLPIILLGLSVTLGMVLGFIQTHPTTTIIEEWKAFILFLPLIVLTRRAIANLADLKKFLCLISLTACLVSLTGIIEFFFPELIISTLDIHKDITYFRINYLGDTESLVTLSSFSTWGTPVVSVILAPIVPLTTFFMIKESRWRRAFWAIAVLIILAGIILSGYRSAWLGLLTSIISLLLIYGKKLWRFFLIALLAGWFLPRGLFERALAIFQPGLTRDPTIMIRLGAAHNVLSSFTVANVLGSGWGSPVVFNDWLYIYTALGVLGGMLFIFLYFSNIIRIINIKDLDSEIKLLKASSIISLVTYMVCMVSGAMSQVRPLMAMFWILFMISWRFPEITDQPKPGKSGVN